MSLALSPDEVLSHEVLLHAERTSDPRVVRWIVRGHLAGPCIEPVHHERGTDGLPPFVAQLLDAVTEASGITVRAEERAGLDVLRIDVHVADPARWRAIAGHVQDAVRDAASLRWWPEDAERHDATPVAIGLRTAGGPAASLPSGPCRSCPRSSSRTSTCGRPPGLPPAST